MQPMMVSVITSDTQMVDQIAYIASCCLHDPDHLSIPMVQTEHRLQLVQGWPIQTGSKVLEIGCGQGDCTAVLASVVGPSGHVTAIDPADLSYGSPFTLGQAQEHLKKSPLGAQIEFKQTDVVPFLLDNPALNYDVAVFVHSIWYFSSPNLFPKILEALKDRVGYVCIAEYALSISSKTALPHLLSVFTQNAYFLKNQNTLVNVRTVLSPVAIRKIAENVGYHLQTSDIITPPAELQDGRWETDLVRSADFLQEVDEIVVDIQERTAIYAMRDAMIMALEKLELESGKPSTMNVWTAVFSTRS